MPASSNNKNEDEFRGTMNILKICETTIANPTSNPVSRWEIICVKALNLPALLAFFSKGKISYSH